MPVQGTIRSVEVMALTVRFSRGSLGETCVMQMYFGASKSVCVCGVIVLISSLSALSFTSPLLLTGLPHLQAMARDDVGPILWNLRRHCGGLSSLISLLRQWGGPVLLRRRSASSASGSLPTGRSVTLTRNSPLCCAARIRHALVSCV
jgi:hypothetical protein